MVTNFKEDLELLDSEHDPSTVKFAEKAPDGTYQARLDICRLGHSKNGRLQTHMKFEITHGEHEGRTVDKYAGMETRENLDWLTKDIWNIAGEKFPFKWKEVETIYPKLLDTVVELIAKTDEGSGIQNVFINKKITKLTNAVQKTLTVDDDVPF
jgi:hypothetical protein